MEGLGFKCLGELFQDLGVCLRNYNHKGVHAARMACSGVMTWVLYAEVIRLCLT